jgi:hypothetical protein
VLQRRPYAHVDKVLRAVAVEDGHVVHRLVRALGRVALSRLLPNLRELTRTFKRVITTK